MIPLTIPLPWQSSWHSSLWNGECEAIGNGCQAAVSTLQVSDSQLRSSDMKGLIDHYFNTWLRSVLSQPFPQALYLSSRLNQWPAGCMGGFWPQPLWLTQTLLVTLGDVHRGLEWSSHFSPPGRKHASPPIFVGDWTQGPCACMARVLAWRNIPSP